MSKEECRRFEKKLAFHTAPSLLGIKCASLFTLLRSEFDIGGNARRIQPPRRREGTEDKGAPRGVLLRGTFADTCLQPEAACGEAQRAGKPRTPERVRLHGRPAAWTSALSGSRSARSATISHTKSEFSLAILRRTSGDSWRMAAAITSCAAAGKYMAAWRVPAGSSQPYDRCREYLCGRLEQGEDLYQALKIS